MQHLGVAPAQAGVAAYRVSAHLRQAGGLAHAATVAQVLQQRERLLRSQTTAEQRRPLSSGEHLLAGAATDHPDLLLVPAPTTPGEISQSPFSIIDTGIILTAELCQFVHG